MAFKDSQLDSSHGSAGDTEKQAHTGTFSSSDGEETFENGDSLYAKLQRIAGRLNIEQRGIERVPEHERHDTSYLNIGSMVCFSFRPSARNVLLLTSTLVAGREHGREFFCHRSAGKFPILPRICRRHSRRDLLQSPRRPVRLFLFLIGPNFWPATDGIDQILVWLVGHQIQ